MPWLPCMGHLTHSLHSMRQHARPITHVMPSWNMLHMHCMCEVIVIHARTWNWGIKPVTLSSIFRLVHVMGTFYWWVPHCDCILSIYDHVSSFDYLDLLNNNPGSSSSSGQLISIIFPSLTSSYKVGPGLSDPALTLGHPKAMAPTKKTTGRGTWYIEIPERKSGNKEMLCLPISIIH